MGNWNYYICSAKKKAYNFTSCIRLINYLKPPLDGQYEKFCPRDILQTHSKTLLLTRLLYFLFHLLPCPVHPIGFSSISSQAPFIFLSWCKRTTTRIYRTTRFFSACISAVLHLQPPWHNIQPPWHNLQPSWHKLQPPWGVPMTITS